MIRSQADKLVGEDVGRERAKGDDGGGGARMAITK